MKTEFCGKVLVVGNNIDTDIIYPGRFLELTDPKEIGSHCLAGISEDIGPNFPQGGIVVAGTNFGCGSSREHAPIALINMGASAVLADSFARIFFRNGINLGLPLIVCKGIAQHVQDGQTVRLNILEGTVTIEETGEVLQAEALGDKAMEILSAGGIKPMMKEKYGN
jgi:3-isopropylmalate dehydratase small subunit